MKFAGKTKLEFAIAWMLLVGLACTAQGQAITRVTFAKLVSNQEASALYLAVEVKNEQHAPITLSTQDFSLLDAKGNVYGMSTSPFSGDELPYARPVWMELPQPINPGVTISPFLLFSLPPDLKAYDLKICLHQSCEAIGSAQLASRTDQLDEYQSAVAGILLQTWQTPEGLPTGVSARVRVSIGPDGELRGTSLSRSSGFMELDSSCADMAGDAEKVAPPPDGLELVIYLTCRAQEGSHSPPSNRASTASPMPVYDMADLLHNGGQVVPPQLIYAPDPQVPADFPREKGFQALVVVGLVCDLDGNPQQVRIVQSYNPELDRVAMETVRQYRFKPSTLNGERVAVRVNIEVMYKNH